MGLHRLRRNYEECRQITRGFIVSFSLLAKSDDVGYDAFLRTSDGESGIHSSTDVDLGGDFFYFSYRPSERPRMLIKTKKEIRIPRKEWERLKKSPNFSELIELLEDRQDLISAKRVRGKDMTLAEYLKKRGIRSNH